MVLVLSGPIHGGKTTFLERSWPRWKARGLACAGFLSLATADESGSGGYDLLELGSGRRQPYLRRRGEPGAERTGPFSFVSAGLERARSIIRGAAAGELLVVDEVGPLELRGGGLWPALREAIGRPGLTILAAAREEILDDLARVVAPAVLRVFDVRDEGALARLDECLFPGTGCDDSQG
jgi:nucleoside-triphosphatase THEP1